MADADPSTGTEASAVQIVDATEDHSFTLNEAALEKILLDPRIRDSKVVVLSVVGAFRKGKSFLLDFFIRYLRDQSSESWTDDTDAPFRGFPWKGGSERCTAGILMWNEPFEVKLHGGQKAFVLLMDTQGAFDCQSTVRDCATIFAMSAMLSSVLVYNISQNIGEDHLQHLQYFTEYGSLALENGAEKPFQDLHFLVRDWQSPDEHNFGLKGGKALLAKRLEIQGRHSEENRLLRSRLHSCFTNINCCLLPYPGRKVATNRNFAGRLSDIEEDFRTYVREFVSGLLSPESLTVKSINGNPVTGKELFDYFRAYIKIFQGDDLPAPMSIFEATAKANNLAAVDKAKAVYREHMDLIAGSAKPCVNAATLKGQHEHHLKEAIKVFKAIRKMGSKETCQIYLEQLQKDLEDMYDNYVSNNSRKGWWNTAKAVGVGFGTGMAIAMAGAEGVLPVAAGTTAGVMFTKRGN